MKILKEMKKQLALNMLALVLFVILFLNIDLIGSATVIFFPLVWVFALAVGMMSVLVQDKTRSYDFILELLLGAIFFSFLSVVGIKYFLYSPGYTYGTLLEYMNPLANDNTPIILILILEYLVGGLFGLLIRGSRLVYLGK